jgi:hypothetical protein
VPLGTCEERFPQIGVRQRLDHGGSILFRNDEGRGVGADEPGLAGGLARRADGDLAFGWKDLHEDLP